MNKRKLGSFALCAMLFALCQPAEAQQPTKVPRIGFLSTALSSVATRTEAFRQGLRELGYVEGKNIIIEWRDAEGKLDRLSELAAELVHLKLDVIVSAAPRPTRAAKEATVTIPVVMAFDNDPVGNGFVDSLARPGGNITGLSTYYSEISGKQLELLKEIVPRLSRVAVIGTSTVPGNEQTLKETELGAKAFGVKLQHLEIQRPQDIENVFRAARKGRRAHSSCCQALSPRLSERRLQRSRPRAVSQRYTRRATISTLVA